MSLHIDYNKSTPAVRNRKMVPHRSFFGYPLCEKVTAFLKIVKILCISCCQLILRKKDSIGCGLPVFGTFFGIISIDARNAGFYNNSIAFLIEGKWVVSLLAKRTSPQTPLCKHLHLPHARLPSTICLLSFNQLWQYPKETLFFLNKIED